MCSRYVFDHDFVTTLAYSAKTTRTVMLESHGGLVVFPQSGKGGHEVVVEHTWRAILF